MDLKIFTMVSSIALAAFLSPPAQAQNRAGGGARPHSGAMSPTQSWSPRAPQGAQGSNTFRNGSNGNGTRWNNQGRDWGNHSGNWGNRYRGCYPRSYYPYYPPGFGCPFGYGYPFGFGFGYGFGYGYGYPYYGTSAAFYDNGYYANRSYRGTGSVVVQVQQRLARSGYYRGRIDGVIGEGTRGAIRAWERAHGLRVDGQIDDRLLSTMDLA
jgi:Putative peptidoglycan binding domain